ncbi:hypothetical protein GCM10010420_54430 [Streptomyces glaucosporus]|uniref:Uncharacterized protein n=1 Tax=Streptomyces glaucosporus TaxID=284044 RepID=A0ABN3IZS8_9ACTN
MSEQRARPSGASGRPEKGDGGQDRERTPVRPVEEDPAVERAFLDDTTATPLATEDEDDRGPLAPVFREPDGPAERDGRRSPDSPDRPRGE